jgi:hypothetical protein
LGLWVKPEEADIVDGWFLSDLFLAVMYNKGIILKAAVTPVVTQALKDMTPIEKIEAIIISGLRDMNQTDFEESSRSGIYKMENAVGFCWGYNVRKNMPALFISPQTRAETGKPHKTVPTVDYTFNGLADVAIELSKNSYDIAGKIKKFTDVGGVYKEWDGKCAILNFQLKGNTLPNIVSDLVYTFIHSENALYRGHKIIVQGVCNNLKTPKCKVINGEDILKKKSKKFEIFYGKEPNKHKREAVEYSIGRKKGRISGFYMIFIIIKFNFSGGIERDGSEDDSDKFDDKSDHDDDDDEEEGNDGFDILELKQAFKESRQLRNEVWFEVLHDHGFKVRKVDGNGNCFLSSLQDQLAIHELRYSLKKLRELAVEGIDDELDAMSPHALDCMLEGEGVSSREEYIKKAKLNKTYLDVPGIQSLGMLLFIFIQSRKITNSTQAASTRQMKITSLKLSTPITVKVGITIPCTTVAASAENVNKRKLAKSKVHENDTLHIKLQSKAR